MNDKNNFIPRHGNPLFYPQDPSEGFQGSSGGLSRRKFLKRTGGATAATFVAWQGLTLTARAATTHCPAHDSKCTWVKSITVNFTTTSVPVAKNGKTPSGRIFHGTMLVTTRNCDGTAGGGSDKAYTYQGVTSGGYISADSPVTPGKDTCAPGGTCGVNPTQTEGTPGYDIPQTGNLRTYIEIHNHIMNPGSHGCITMNSTNWTQFQNLMNEGDDSSNCVHNPPNPVPIVITYSMTAPTLPPDGHAPPKL